MNILVPCDSAELVLCLAALTEDRAPKEDRALVDLAFRIDQERNALVSTNTRVGKEPVSDLVGWLGLSLDQKREATRQRRLAAWPKNGPA